MNESVPERERVMVTATAVPAAVAGCGAAGRVLIAPWGQVQSSNGDFVVDDEAGRLVAEAFAAHGTDVPVDYEHQSLGGTYSSPSGQAPAAGWIKALQLVSPEEDPQSPGLYARVEWTPAAQDKLAAREYRYLSPVVIVRKRDRRMVGLHSAALTNKPAIVGMRPIVNKEEGGQVAKCETEKVGMEQNDAVEVLRLRLGLEEGAQSETVMLTAEQRLGELMAEVARRDAAERVVNATRAGKLVPVQQDWAMALALSDPAGFDEWAATAPVVVRTGRTEPPQSGTEGRQREVIAASARAAYRSEPGLALLTSEEAWVEQAVREAK